MKTEFEVKILNINVEEIKKKLECIGAVMVKDRNMKRYVYDIDPNRENYWIRLRDNGEKVTLTVKEIHDETIEGTKEAEVVVGDFDGTHLILNKLGFVARAYQENKRISYVLDDVEIEIDFWPKIPPYIEIEGKSKEDVSKVVKLLGYKMEDTTSKNTDLIYEMHGINIYDFKELKF